MMNAGLKEKFEFHVQKRLTGVDGYTQVWQCLGPSIDALALLVLIHVEEGSGFSLQDVVEEGVELGLVAPGRTGDVVDMLRQEGLMAGTDEAPEVGHTARRLVEGLNETYPKMSGIVLPAYLVQILQELLDGRNELEKALDQVDQTLIPQEEDDSIPVEDPAVAEARRERFLKRIASIRSRMMNEKGRELKVKEINASARNGGVKTLVVSSEDEETSAPGIPVASADPRADAVDSAPKPSQEEIQREAFLALQREKMELERQKEELLKEKQRLEDERSRSGRAEDPLESEEKAAMESLTRGESDEDIAAAVARFQESLSLSCPVCGTGKLDTRNTDNGKTFYRCDNRSCGFVTWKRPYPFACPTCKNPFLVENDEGDGLSCPRSVCTFKQKGLEAPQEKKAASGGVRRVRKVRRVVRKKK